MSKVKNVLVEKELINGSYLAIVDHHEQGRILLREMKNFEGDNFGYWSQGFAAKLLPTDTLETLSQMLNDHVTILDRLSNAYDDDRPMLNWAGYMVEKVAASVGL